MRLIEHTYPSVTIQTQRGLVGDITRCVGGKYNSSFDVADYDGCPDTMTEIAKHHLRDINTQRPAAFYKLIHMELISDNPLRECHIFASITELGQELLDAHNRGIIFDIALSEINIDATRSELSKALESRYVQDSVIDWFKRVDHPDLLDLKRLFVLKKLRAVYDNGWLSDPKDPQ